MTRNVANVSGVHVPWIFEAYGAFAWDHTHGQLARTSKQDQAWRVTQLSRTIGFSCGREVLAKFQKA
ncbi:hypothetical protein VDGE_30245 [Verticillium dahliae]|uniref:Uncharacterized protein n=1 Tax=Verticillium dahliae TaxID=27337 RepID=A0A444RP87_VERDA|nr:hypothetical protein VDGE_30245 [Verticillium dahliae]